MVNIENELQTARQKLLDLTMRNPLLNFRTVKTRTINVTNESLTEIYRTLVIKENKMQFYSMPKINVENTTKANEQINNETSNQTKFLQTTLEEEELKKRVMHISRQARTATEEQGYTILYLAMGFLEWTESSKPQRRSAPLILVPIKLERIKISMPFKLSWTGEDIITNISLQKKIEEQEICLPDFEMSDDIEYIDNYLQSVVMSISTKPDWKVVTDVYAGFFNFTKLIMYKDLDPNAWPVNNSPTHNNLLRTIFDKSKIVSSEIGFSENEVDEKLSAKDVCHVMEADPSQIAVIEDVKNGHNLVVEGPPGTGKSQTITNIIAELLAAGKTVLFLSEKMGALEVVKNRLDQIGLSDFCLELHSTKTNKKEVLKQLEHSINKSPLQPISLDEKFKKSDYLKSKLNNYARVLREPFGNIGLSPFALYCMKESAIHHFSQVGREMPHISLHNLQKCDHGESTKAMSALTNIAEALPLVKPVTNNPWNGCNPGIILPSDEREITELIHECKMSIYELKNSIDRLVENCAVNRPTTKKELQRILSAAKIVMESKPINRNVLLYSGWKEANYKALLILSKLEQFNEKYNTVSSMFEEEALDQDIVSILKEFIYRSNRFIVFRLLDRRYHQLKHKISYLYKNGSPKSSKKIVSDLNELVDCIKLREELRNPNSIGKQFFGSYWHEENSDFQLLHSFTNWIIPFQQLLQDNVFTDSVVDEICGDVPRKQIESSIDCVDKALQCFNSQLNLFANRIDMNYEMIFGLHPSNLDFQDLLSHLDIWQNKIAELSHWGQFISLRNLVIETVAAPVVKMIDSDLLEPEDVIPCFEANFADEMLRVAFAEMPTLSDFVVKIHENTIQNFVEIDNELLNLNRQRLVQILNNRQPHICEGISSLPQADVLLCEINRKRSHMPIRKLMSHAGGLIQKIKPCVLMSPRSVAQFLDPQVISFDVLIFDEASQIKPEDAIGALLRSNQAVVIGDTCQLPPTDFFEHIIEEEEEGKLPIQLTDIESILHLCKLSFPTKMLKWHYRSKHESLIAVSNQEFYDNRLIIYPSPINKSEHFGLHLVHLPETTYDPGRTSINREEAKEIANAVFEHYQTYPDKSLGVGTFNIKQQKAILEEIELLLQYHPEMEVVMTSNKNEPFFVKNLETIQGDERDVIFISTGFGFDEYGHFSHNFGPLNRLGGERRLNVIMSRAREKCVVFSNFQAKDISVDAHTSFGLRTLKKYMNYAENRNLGGIEVAYEDAESSFEYAIYNFLISQGYDVQRKVGCAGFRVDLAVVNPNNPDCYILGIECDGPKYYSSTVARERDKLRQQILEKLGWKICRVWSTNWYRNCIESKKILLDAIEHALDFEKLSVDVMQDSPVPTPAQESHDDITIDACTDDNIICVN